MAITKYTQLHNNTGIPKVSLPHLSILIGIKQPVSQRQCINLKDRPSQGADAKHPIDIVLLAYRLSFGLHSTLG